LGRSLLLVLLSVTSFVATCNLVRGLVPYPETGGRRDKWEYWEEHAEDYDAVFIGSSHVFHSVVPEVLEDELGRRGIEFRSFNLGTCAVWGVEADYLLDLVLARRSRRLKWIFLETGMQHADRLENPPLHVRHFHTLRSTRDMISIALDRPKPLVERLQQVLGHVHICLENLANVGQGKRVLGRALGGEWRTVVVGEPTLAEGAGYEPLEDADPEGRRRTRMLEREEEWRTRVELRLKYEPKVLSDGTRGELLPSDVAIVRRQVERVREAGYELVHFVPPRVEPITRAARLDQAGLLPTLVDFGTPVSHPELFRFELWYDFTHLNEEGARRFSALLADEIAELVD